MVCVDVKHHVYLDITTSFFFLLLNVRREDARQVVGCIIRQPFFPLLNFYTEPAKNTGAFVSHPLSTILIFHEALKRL